MQQSVSCETLQELLNQGGQLIDVRTPAEFGQNALPGAINIPVQSIQSAANRLDMNKPVMVYCRTGRRSAYAKMWLEAIGFNKIVDLVSPQHVAHCTL